MRSRPDALFTIGHSDRAFDEFRQLLQDNDIDTVVDVRKLPGSKRNPQYDAEALGRALADAGIELSRADGLAGRRPVSKDIPFEVNSWWTNRSFHNYADHALGEQFAAALAGLRRLSRDRRVAVMCSEAVWWRCHRRIIADHLLANGDQVRHIVGNSRPGPAELSAGAVIGDRTNLTFRSGPLTDDVERAGSDSAAAAVRVVTYPAREPGDEA